MANVFLGTAVSFGVAGTTALTGYASGTFKLQSEDHAKSASVDTVKDADGISVQRTYYDPSETATFTFFLAAASQAAMTTFLGSATSLVNIGSISTVTNAADVAIAGTNWIVTGIKAKRTNTSAKEITLDLERFTGTGAISAVTT